MGSGRAEIDVTIIMPCLNEAISLPACIANARAALALMYQRFGLAGEIVIADNGSTDGSQAIATALGARCVAVPRRGYGAALIGGATAAHGRYLVMGDADGSYDFRDAVPMVGRLMQGADLCMGNRFQGGIAPGAMPWKNRYIGNPILTGILNILFRSGIGDAHCGIRALTRPCFDSLRLSGDGMEFASEMVIKATLKGAKIVEVPATLSKDLRDRPPHLRPWRDGWRHLRYLLMLSPAWIFAIPAAVLGILAVAILGASTVAALGAKAGVTIFGNYWVVLGGGLLTISHTAATRGTVPINPQIGCLAVGLGLLGYLVSYWSANQFQPILNVLPAVLGTSLVVIGAQNVLGGFLLSIIGGNDADFMKAVPQSAPALVPVAASEPALARELA